MADIWVFVEQVNDAPSALGLELLAKAREMGDVTALFLGEGSDQVFATLGDHGADSVVHIDAGDRLPFWAMGARANDNVLFDLDNDPGERENLIGTPREKEAEELLRAALAEVEAPAEHLERLGLA